MKLITGDTAKKSTELISKAITSIATRGKKLDNDIWIAGCSCINHLELHGDVTLLNRLVAAMPKGSRVNALREWIESFAKVRYNTETKEFDYDKSKVNLLDDAMATSWVEFKPEPAYQAMDFDVELAKVIKKALSRVKSDKGDKIDSKKLEAVMSAIGYKEEM